ncbi:glucose-6-phosphate dehydrogenase [Candidatus Berkelbacteria bacterium]|nr:glucose-6-phosphate dehydrogenase [Candidatus Berkelbacteria bacterium]
MDQIPIGHNPTIFVLFGASGDLVAKKIIPALFLLFNEGKLPSKFRVVGFARSKFTDQEFKQKVKDSLIKSGSELNEAANLAVFLDLFSYHQGQYDSVESFHSLNKILQAIGYEWGLCSSTLFYLAVPPKVYSGIFSNLKKSKIAENCSPEEGWSRIIVEKPFGMDLKSAEQLDLELSDLFHEEQIYRIDHYLAKEMLQSIITFRFANNLFERTWNNQFIESIEMSLLEELGVEQRGKFYDEVGALRDVGQNHLLQMLALILMDQPSSYEARDIREKRAEALATSLATLDEDEIIKQTFRAQYDGYQKIEGVDPVSQTETYFRIKTKLTGKRWWGVPVMMEAGKRTGQTKKQIVVNFKHPTPCLCPAGNHFKNKVVFSLGSDEGIKIDFWTKKPGLTTEQEPRSIDFSLYDEGRTKRQYVEEYAKLVLDAINGDQILFVGTDEIKQMWRFTDSINFAWYENLIPLNKYLPDDSNLLKEASRVDFVPEQKMPKRVGIVGLGKMGAGLAQQLLTEGWEVSGWNRSAPPRDRLKERGLRAYDDLTKLVKDLPTPRVVWLMLPAGKLVDDFIFGSIGLNKLLEAGDYLIDGGNSYYKDSKIRSDKLAKLGIKFIDVGVSGGPKGALNGACLMIGGQEDDFNYLESLFADLSVSQGYQWFEGAGAGHFVKMVHNGIEYGMMQAIAEGFGLMKKSNYELDLTRVASVYNRGSVIESRLVGWLEDAFRMSGDDLEGIKGQVDHTGEGAWTVQEAQNQKFKAQVIEAALKFRIDSADQPSYTGKILSALRGQFGGHATEEK